MKTVEIVARKNFNTNVSGDNTTEKEKIVK